MINDLFENFEKPIRVTPKVCNSGGASGSDYYFDKFSSEYGVKVNNFSYKTPYHNSVNKIEISDEDYELGVNKVKEANRLILKRNGIDKYMNLLARNYAQVKYSENIYAIGRLVVNKNNDKHIVDGGTGYAVAMAIVEKKPVFVFDLNDNMWYIYDYVFNKFILLKEQNLTINCENFAGIGTRQINESGINAIKNLLSKTFE